MMGGNALITGAQTGGDPTAMATSAAFAGAGGLAAKGLNKLAKGTARGQAEIVSAKRTAEAAKKVEGGSANNAMNDPLWMKAQEGNTAKFTELIQKYGLTGQPEKDIAVISKAPEREQEVLSALSRQMNPAKHQLGHEWSMAELVGNAMPAAIGGLGDRRSHWGRVDHGRHLAGSVAHEKVSWDRGQAVRTRRGTRAGARPTVRYGSGSGRAGR
jgi:hypothetical protein